MTTRGGARSVAWVCVFAGLALSCSKSAGDSKAASTSTRVLPGSYPAPASNDPVDPGAIHRSRDPFERTDYDAAPLTYTVIEIIEASAAVHTDPDEAVMEAARSAGAACFSALQGGPDVRSATVHVTVVPTGSVSRTEVGGVSEPEVLDCLRRIGDGLHFSSGQGQSQNGRPSSEDNDSTSETIRSFSIDVSVSRAH